MNLRHLRSQLVLRAIARAEVTEDGELEGSGPVGQGNWRFHGRLLHDVRHGHGGRGQEGKADDNETGSRSDEALKRHFGNTSGMKSAMTCACESSRMRLSPMKRYSMSSLSAGSVCKTCGGTLEIGTVSG